MQTDDRQIENNLSSHHNSVKNIEPDPQMQMKYPEKGTESQVSINDQDHQKSQTMDIGTGPDDPLKPQTAEKFKNI